MRSFISTGVIAAVAGLSNTGLLKVNAQISGQHVYNDGDGLREQSHVDYHIDDAATCGVLVDNHTRLQLQQSTISRVQFSGVNNLSAGDMIGNAVVCALDEAELLADHDYIEFHNDFAAGFWTSGFNTTTHLSNVRVTSLGNSTWGIVSSNHSTVVASNVEMESNRTGSCGFVANGGSLSVDYSVVYADGPTSAGLCVEGVDPPSGMVDARGVTSSSLEGVAAWLYGAAGQISFTNCTLIGGGAAAILSSSRPRGLAEPRVINIVDSTVAATNPNSPVLYYAFTDSNTHIYNSTLNAASTDLIVSTCSSTAFENCTAFFTNISISESEVEGNIQAWEPSRLRLDLTWYTRWTGSVVNTPSDVASSTPDVYLDDTSVWTVNKDSWVRALVSSLGNVSNIIAAEPNITIRYNSGALENAYLLSQAFEIEGGGFVQPYLTN